MTSLHTPVPQPKIAQKRPVAIPTDIFPTLCIDDPLPKRQRTVRSNKPKKNMLVRRRAPSFSGSGGYPSSQNKNDNSPATVCFVDDFPVEASSDIYMNVDIPKKVEVEASACSDTIALYYDRKFADEFNKLAPIGSGKFGEVRLVESKATGTKYAAKVFYKDGHPLHRTGDYSEQEINAEVMIMTKLNHPNLVRLEAVYDESERTTLLLQLATGGDLRSFALARIHQSERAIQGIQQGLLQADPEVKQGHQGCLADDYYSTKRLQWRPCGSFGLITEREVACFMVDALAAVASLHANGIAHRDIKIDNFLRSDDTDESNLLLCDFGFAASFPRDQQQFTKYCGSLLYMAPEVLVMKEEHRKVASSVGFYSLASEFATNEGSKVAKLGYGLECDLWSLGVVLFILLSGQQPFSAENRQAIARKIFTNQINSASVG